MAPRPPDILRKSHAHTEGKARAGDKRALREALDAELDPADTEPVLLIDLDGVVYFGGEAVTGAAEAIAWLKDNAVPHLFVTNTSSKPASALSEKLAGFGIDVDAGAILAPPEAAAAWLEERGCRRLELLVPEATRPAFAGFETGGAGDEPVDAVVVGDLGGQWSFERLNRAFRLLLGEPAPYLIALGMTRYWKAPDGFRLDTAPFVVALAHASGVEPVVLGKPAAEFFDAAVARLGAPRDRCWVVGDDIRADVAGAQSAGLRAALVKTGKFRPGDLERGIEPELVLESIAELPRRWHELHRRRESR